MDLWVNTALNQQSIAAVFTAGACATLLALRLGYKYTQRQRKLTQVGVVSQLVLYPLKSGKGVLVTETECLRMGLRNGELRDRHWLVVTEEDGRMVTGRREPRLVLVSITTDGGDLCLSAPDMEELRVPLHQPNNKLINCRVYTSDIHGRDCGDEVSDWLMRYLASEKTVRMVHFEAQMKPRKCAQLRPLFPADEKVSYTDIAPIMLLSEASLKDLNSRLEKDVPVAQFRPNIVVTDCEAFSEDSWDEIQIGTVRMKQVMACGRCVFTAVDPETGLNNSKEAFQTLKSYRQCDPLEKKIYKTSPLFGQYYIVKQTGTFHIGDPVYKISY